MCARYSCIVTASGACGDLVDHEFRGRLVSVMLLVLQAGEYGVDELKGCQAVRDGQSLW